MRVLAQSPFPEINRGFAGLLTTEYLHLLLRGKVAEGHSVLATLTAEFIIIDPLHGRRGINSLSHTGSAVVLLSANYTTMLAPYNRVNVYDPRYRLAAYPRRPPGKNRVREGDVKVA